MTHTRDTIIRTLHTDSDSEFKNKKVTNYLDRRTIHPAYFVPDFKGSNGIAERHIGIVMELTQVLLIPSRPPPFLSPEPVKHVAHLRNPVPHKRILQNSKHKMLKDV